MEPQDGESALAAEIDRAIARGRTHRAAGRLDAAHREYEAAFDLIQHAPATATLATLFGDLAELARQRGDDANGALWANRAAQLKE